METGMAQWHYLAALVAAVLLLLAVMWVWRRAAGRRESERRIEAARIRSGHLPLEIPTVRSSLDPSDDSVPDTLPEWFIQGKGEHAVVDEHPRIRVRYIDAHDKKIECVIQVDHLDLQKKIITGRGDMPGETRRVPLHRIHSARIAESGQRFNVDTWVEAVRVARRRRGRV